MTIANCCAIVGVVGMLAFPSAAQTSQPARSASDGPAVPAAKIETPPALAHAKALIDSRHFAEAAEECTRLIDSAAGSIFDRNAALFCRALALQGMAKRADALADVQALQDSKKCTPELRQGALVVQLMLHRELKDWPAVLRDAATLRPLSEDKSQAWLLMAILQAHFEQDENEKALNDCNDGLALANLAAEDRATFRLERGLANERLNRLPAAREDYAAVLRDRDTPAGHREAAKAHLEELQLNSATQPTTRKS